MVTRTLPVVVVLLGGLLASSCQSVLGIEKLETEPRLALGGAGGTLGMGGGQAGSEASPSNGSGGVSGVGGAAGEVGGGAGSGGVAGGSAPDAGSPDDADAAAVPEAPLLVSGRVIDYFRHAVPSTPVSIGDVTVLTGQNGEFSFPDVAAPYTVSLVATRTLGGGAGFARYGYVYEGLTRSDPTLQVYTALTERSSDLTLQFANGDFDADPDRGVAIAFSSPDTHYGAYSIDSAETTLLGSPSWTGPTVTTGNIHALRLLRPDASFDGEPPVAFEAYQTSALAVADGMPSNVSFDMQAQAIASANVAGSVTGGTLSNRRNLVSLRFTDGTVLPFLDAEAQDGFSYLVPNLPGASLIVAAADGFTAPYTVAYREGIAPGQQGVALSIPEPVTLNAPPGGAAVGSGTLFRWSALAQTARTFVWHMESVGYFEGIYVITARTEIPLPTVRDFSVIPGDVYWSVETHGDAADVDALTGPDGFLSSFARGRDNSSGPLRGDGYFTESEQRGFTLGTD